MKKQMQINCPECGLKNEVIIIPGGFFFDQVEYKCACGYYITTFALNYTRAKNDLKQQIRKDVMLALGKVALK